MMSPCAKVSERHHVPAMRIAASPCQATIQNKVLKSRASGSVRPRADASEAEAGGNACAVSAAVDASAGSGTRFGLAKTLDNVRPDPIRHRARQLLPQRDERTIFGIEWIVVGNLVSLYQPVFVG